MHPVLPRTKWGKWSVSFIVLFFVLLGSFFFYSLREPGGAEGALSYFLFSGPLQTVFLFLAFSGQQAGTSIFSVLISVAGVLGLFAGFLGIISLFKKESFIENVKRCYRILAEIIKQFF